MIACSFLIDRVRGLILSMIVLGGSASAPLADKVSKELGTEPGRLEVKRFPDGEKYLRVLADVKDQDVAVIQSLYRSPDEYLFELMLITDTLRDLGARSITSVAPYLAYARQDARFYPGEAISSVSIARFLEAAGTTRFLTIESQLHRLQGISKVFKVPAKNLSAMPLLGKYAREILRPKNAVVIGPDEEAETWAATAAKELEAAYIVFRKKRTRLEHETSSRVEIDAGNVELKGRDVVFADDIISTGGTIAEAAKACRRKGARRIFALCTHPVLAEGALKRLRGAGISKVIGTDTIPSPISKVSVAPVIARALKVTN